MPQRLFCLLSLSLVLLPGLASRAESRPVDNTLVERLPQHTIPLLTTAPVIDGNLDPREWVHALQFAPLIETTTGRIERNQTVSYAAYTEDGIYLAWQVRRSPDAGPLRLRVTDPGAHARGVWADDTVEVFLDIGRTGQRAINFVGNAAGAFSDGLAAPTVDASQSWPWQYAARQTDAGWEGELAISFKSLGLNGPLEPGTVWGFDLVRNNKTPESVISQLAYRHRWHDLGKYSLFRFGGHIPSIRVTDGGAIGEAMVGALAEITNATAQPQQVTVAYEIYRRKANTSSINFLQEVDSGTVSDDEAGGYTMADADKQIRSLLTYYELVKRAEDTVTTAPGGRSALNLTAADSSVGDYLIGYRFTQGNQVLATALLPATRWQPLDVQVIPYYLSSNQLHVIGSIHSKRVRDSIKTVQMQLLDANKVLVERQFETEAALEGVDLPVDKVAVGPYRLVVEGLDATGKVVSRSERKMLRPQPPFWATEKNGTRPFVPEPFTPVEASADTVRVWGRTYHFGDSFLPEQITTGGEQLLAGPPRLRIGIAGRQIEPKGTLKLVSHDAEQATYQWVGRAGSLPVLASIRVEYDGFITLDLEVQAEGTTIDAMFLELPLRPEHAELYTLNKWLFEPERNEQRPEMAGRIGTGFRTGFNYAAWLGTVERGLQWCAEDYEHWSNQDRTRSIDVEPGEDAVTLRLRVIDKPLKADQPLRYRWGLNASPVRPAWDGHANFYYFQGGFGPDFPEDAKSFEYQLQFAKAMGATWHSSFSSWNEYFGQPLLEDPESIERARQAVRMVHEHGMRETFYTGWNALHPQMKDWPFFGQEMVRRPSRFNQGGYAQCNNSPYADYLVNGIGWMIREIGVDGVYLDSTAWPTECTDPHHVCGWEDLQTGRRMPTGNIWATREMFKRMYKVLHGEVIKDGILYSHAGQPPLLAVEAFIDIKHAGEGAYHAESLKDYFDIDSYQARYNATQYGWPMEHTWSNRSPIPRNSVWGIALLHDNAIKIYSQAVMADYIRKDTYAGKAGIDWKMWAPRQWFDPKGGQFYAYYENGNVLKTGDADVLASFRINSKKQVVLYLTNLAAEAKRVELTFDVKALGLPALMYGRDPVTNETVEMRDGRLSLEILGERPRVVMMDVSKVPEVTLKLPEQ